MGESFRASRRRAAHFSDRVWIAIGGATLLFAWLRLPLLHPNLGWTHDPRAGMALRFIALGRELSWALEWTLLVAALFSFQSALGRFDLSRLRLTRPLLGTVTALVVIAALGSVGGGLHFRAVFVPISLGALWVSASFGLGAGLLTVLGSAALCALSGMPEAVSAPLLARAVGSVLFFQGGKSSWDGLRAGTLAGILSGAVAVSLSLGRGEDWPSLAAGFGWYLAGGLVEGGLYLLTRGLGERLLGHVSRERLVALLDLSQPLLQQMVHRAPGSFEHSRAMANLAEQAASAIGADALLTRVGAYYHDLGKSLEPKFFVENLDPGESSAHEGLSPRTSARHIVSHVSQGVALLRNGGIPEPVVEFAYTHHGTQLVEYFLSRERKLAAEEGREVNIEEFRYPGMKPGTKETAILMVVDSIEAASRTLDTPERELLEDMVRRIVFSKLAAEQLDESGLTMKELRVVCSRVVQTLVHMNHHRIKYPWQEERAHQFGVGKRELPSLAQVPAFPRALAGGA